MFSTSAFFHIFSTRFFLDVGYVYHTISRKFWAELLAAISFFSCTVVSFAGSGFFCLYIYGANENLGSTFDFSLNFLFLWDFFLIFLIYIPLALDKLRTENMPDISNVPLFCSLFVVILTTYQKLCVSGGGIQTKNTFT